MSEPAKSRASRVVRTLLCLYDQECCCIHDEAKIGGPSISIPYFAMSSGIVSGFFLSIGTLPISSKNF
jgi:hypothetical protein